MFSSRQKPAEMMMMEFCLINSQQLFTPEHRPPLERTTLLGPVLSPSSVLNFACLELNQKLPVMPLILRIRVLLATESNGVFFFKIICFDFWLRILFLFLNNYDVEDIRLAIYYL